MNVSLVNAKEMETTVYNLSEEMTKSDKDNQTRIGWVFIEDNWYYLDESGKKKTNWLSLNGEWYYLDSSGIMQTGWVNQNNTWYYFDLQGRMQTGWLDLNGTWYYLDKLGKMQVGWLELNGVWYYLDLYGKMQTDWVNLNSIWYYLDVFGRMQTGWLYENDDWYYLDTFGKMQTGWLQLSSIWYYINESGRMVVNDLIGNWHITQSGKANFIPNLELDKFNKYQEEVFNLVNIEREKNGVPELKFNKKISNVATVKSQDMINKDYFDHESPTYGSPFGMMSDFGITFFAAGENIALGYTSPKSVVEGWMKSPGHRENILSSYFNELGVGIAQDSKGRLYWTQMFILDY